MSFHPSRHQLTQQSFPILRPLNWKSSPDNSPQNRIYQFLHTSSFQPSLNQLILLDQIKASNQLSNELVRKEALKHLRFKNNGKFFCGQLSVCSKYLINHAKIDPKVNIQQEQKFMSQHRLRRSSETLKMLLLNHTKYVKEYGKVEKGGIKKRGKKWAKKE